MAPAGSEARRGGGGSSGGGSEESGDEGEEESESEEETDDSYLCAKLHLVDLAGARGCAQRDYSTAVRMRWGCLMQCSEQPFCYRSVGMCWCCVGLVV